MASCKVMSAASAGAVSTSRKQAIKLTVQKLTSESFRPYGQVQRFRRHQVLGPLPTHQPGPLTLIVFYGSVVLSTSSGTLVQVVSSNDDGKQFDHEDAQLQLDQGTPRCTLLSFMSSSVLMVQHTSLE